MIKHALAVYTMVSIISVVFLLVYVYTTSSQRDPLSVFDIQDTSFMTTQSKVPVKFVHSEEILPQNSSSRHTGPPKTWRKGSFCYDHLVNTFDKGLPMCGNSVTELDQVRCNGSRYTEHMALCFYHNIAMRPIEMQSAIPNDVEWNKPKDKAVNLLLGTEFKCNTPSLEQLQKKTDRDDYQLRLTRQMIESSRLSPSACNTWINKTTFLHVSNSLHIYFRFMNLYSVHKAILDFGIAEGDYQVVRIGNLNKGYRFPEFDEALFPGALSITELPSNAIVCFKKAVLTPRSYQSVPFRCKMETSVRKRCFECNGRNLVDSPFQSFRRRVLRACNVADRKINKSSMLVVISRKPYARWSTDDPKKFQRVLRNEKEMINEIKITFPKATVQVLHMEELSVCEQVRYAVEADVMLGVHGAGLVHFWWMREEAMALELEPAFEASNPSFRMLTTLSGRAYQSETTSGTQTNVRVNINNVINKIRLHMNS